MAKALSGRAKKPTDRRSPSNTSLDWAIMAILTLAILLAGLCTLLLPISPIHSLVIRGLVTGDLIGAGASFVYGARHSRIRPSLALSLAFISAAAWELAPETSKPGWTAFVPAILLILALIPWFSILSGSTRTKA